MASGSNGGTLVTGFVHLPVIQLDITYSFSPQILRPQLATFNVTNGLISGLKVIKPVAWGWNVPGRNVKIENHYVDAKPENSTRDSTVSFPFNTDGFNLSGQNITLDGYWGENG